LDDLLDGNEFWPDTFCREAKLLSMVERLRSALPRLAISTKASPKVSVIVPVYNQIFYTLACLISLFESKPEITFEVIVGNDCSFDETPRLLADVHSRIRVVGTESNLGFLKNCNNAAMHAGGEVIVLLNNDMILLPGWLESLVSRVQADSRHGMVGSKLLNLDGSLQEAGGILWRDGTAWNYGRNQNPMAPEFNYSRKVDYCSGASICLRKDVWELVGGFDEAFAPAYCEDSDLACRLRSRGFSVVYEPRSVGVHLEGISCGKDLSTGTKAYQVENQKKLYSRWFSALNAENFENGVDVFAARGRTRSEKWILMIDHYVPQHDCDAGSRTILNVIECFLENGWHVAFWPENLHFDPKYTRQLQSLGVLVLYSGEFVGSFEQWFKDHARYLSGVFLSRPQVAAEVLPAIKRNSNLTVAYYGHDVHHLRMRLKAELLADSSDLMVQATKMEELERGVWDQSDFVLYPSKEEVDYVNGLLPCPKTRNLARVLVPWAFNDFPDEVTADLPDRHGLLFVGGFNHEPNQEAVLWFARNVWPILLLRFPNLTLTLAGSNPTKEIQALQANNILVTGYITDADLRLLYSRHRVSVAPLLHGAGVKGKVVEALRNGLPVVTTAIGGQGIEDSNGCLAIVESREQMASAILALLTDDNLWAQRSSESIRLAKRSYSKEAMWSSIKDLF
jgi:GT2 family glycosyltransferase